MINITINFTHFLSFLINRAIRTFKITPVAHPVFLLGKATLCCLVFDSESNFSIVFLLSSKSQCRFPPQVTFSAGVLRQVASVHMTAYRLEWLLVHFAFNGIRGQGPVAT